MRLSLVNLIVMWYNIPINSSWIKINTYMKEGIAMSDKSIPILAIENVSSSMGITNNKLSDILQNTSSTVTSVSADVLRRNISTVAHDFLEVCQDATFDTPIFELDEIELALSIGGEGEVSIFSVAAAKANMQASVILRFKRKNNE